MVCTAHGSVCSFTGKPNQHREQHAMGCLGGAECIPTLWCSAPSCPTLLPKGAGLSEASFHTELLHLHC